MVQNMSPLKTPLKAPLTKGVFKEVFLESLFSSKIWNGILVLEKSPFCSILKEILKKFFKGAFK